MTGARPWVTNMQEVIEWLESPEGERWSKFRHRWNSDNAVFRSFLMVIKDDAATKGEEFEVFLWVA